MADTIVKNRPNYFIADDSQRQFAYTVDIQNRVATTLAKVCIEVGIQKCTILIAELINKQI